MSSPPLTKNAPSTLKAARLRGIFKNFRRSKPQHDYYDGSNSRRGRRYADGVRVRTFEFRFETHSVLTLALGVFGRRKGRMVKNLLQGQSCLTWSCHRREN